MRAKSPCPDCRTPWITNKLVSSTPVMWYGREQTQYFFAVFCLTCDARRLELEVDELDLDNRRRDP